MYKNEYVIERMSENAKKTIFLLFFFKKTMLYKEKRIILKGVAMSFMTKDEMNALCAGRFQGDPFSALGMHLCSKNILTPF